LHHNDLLLIGWSEISWHPIFDKKSEKYYICDMTALTIHPENADQDTAIRTILDALHVKYEEVDGMDETEYLNSSPANVEHLNRSIAQIDKGQGVEVDLDTLLPK
jgi:hypothetical protein